MAQEGLARLAKLGVDLGKTTERLLADGITSFTHALDELLVSAGANLQGYCTEARVETALTNNKAENKKHDSSVVLMEDLRFHESSHRTRAEQDRIDFFTTTRRQ